MILSQFQNVGRDLFVRGLVSSHSGNLSIRLGERMVITRRSAMLGCLDEHDLIETGVSKNDRSTPLASVELCVHRAIYQQTPALAIVHAHPPHAIALSLTGTEIVPRDSEGLSIMKRVPVLGWHKKIEPGGLTELIAKELSQHQIIIVHTHGSFAIGQLLDEALHYTTTLQESCKVLYLLKSLQINSTKI